MRTKCSLDILRWQRGSRPASGARCAGRGGGGEPLPELLRRALHGRMSDAHRRAALHPEDRFRQRDRLGEDDPRRKCSGGELRARLPGGGALRGRLRAAWQAPEAD